MLIADRAADWGIRIGGIFVILAVLGIMAYLVQVVVPLFTGARILEHHAVTVPQRGETLMEVIDDYRTIAVSIERSGEVTVLHLATGRAVPGPGFDFSSGQPTAFARSLAGGDVVFGFADGTLRFGTLR
ncbi:MAG: ABC transporter permease subunit, partial [Pseudomonadota bacterium]